jgi:hypothetical protein
VGVAIMKNRFYLACFRDNVGSNVGFHRINGNGYTTNVKEAHVYTKEEAQRAWNRGREYDQPICADSVDALTVYKVDCQYIPNETQIPEDADEHTLFVAFRPHRWDGNDVFWIQESGTSTTDFTKAVTFTSDSSDALFSAVKEMMIVIPAEMAEQVKRKTFDFSKFDRRKMVQSAGLKQPGWLKQQKRRRYSGKTRWNCPACGKISWQHNPYDFDGCKDVQCKEWRC